MAHAEEIIFVIDDEPGMCDSLSALLQGDGFRVHAFQQPRAALTALREHKVDLVLSDIKMPEMDGLELLRQVKEVDEGIPVILMTAFGSMDTALDAIKQGAYDYLLKPVEFQQLQVVVNRALDRRRSELARLRLLEELKLSNLILSRRVGELNALYEAGKSLGSTAKLGDLLRQIVVLAATVTEAQVGSIMLLDERREFLTIEAAIGLHEEIVARTRIPIGSSIAGYVAKAGEPLIVEDVEQDERFRRINQEKYGNASLLCIPLKIKNSVLGVINMANKEGGRVFSTDDLRLLTTFASQAAVAVDDAYQFERNRRRLVEFEILHEITREMQTVNTLTGFRTMLVSKLRRVFPIDMAIWFTWEASSRSLIPDGAVGVHQLPLTESGRIDLSWASRMEIALTNCALQPDDFDDIAKLTGYVADRLGAHEQYPDPVGACLAIPIFKGGSPAYLFFLAAHQERNYSEDDISLAKLVISQASLLFEREKALLNGTRLLTMGNMVSEIAHDLRRPLTNIRGGLQVVQAKLPDTPEQAKLFAMVQDEVYRMNEMVKELIDFSKPDKYETSKEDLRQVIQRATDLLGPDIRRHNVTLSTNFGSIDHELIINRNQILEVFLNLMINALDAMPDGGTLAVTTLMEQPEHRKEPYVAIRIADTGSGIKKENLSRIFERYYTTKETGTGLGLVVVERILSAHGGTIAVKSVEGTGTTMTVYLPQSITL